MFNFNLLFPFVNLECSRLGYYWDVLNDECIPCPFGTYSDTEKAVNAESCTACPERQTTSEEGSTRSSDCYTGKITLLINLCSNDITSDHSFREEEKHVVQSVYGLL